MRQGSESCDDANDDPADGCDACRLPTDPVATRSTSAVDLIATDALYLLHGIASSGDWISVTQPDGSPVATIASDSGAGAAGYTAGGVLAVAPSGDVFASRAIEPISRATPLQPYAGGYRRDGTELWAQSLPGDTRSNEFMVDAAATDAFVAFVGRAQQAPISAGASYPVRGVIYRVSRDGWVEWRREHRFSEWSSKAVAVGVNAAGTVCAAGEAASVRYTEWDHYWVACYSALGDLLWEREMPEAAITVFVDGPTVGVITATEVLAYSLSAGAPRGTLATFSLPADTVVTRARRDEGFYVAVGTVGGASYVGVLDTTGAPVWEAVRMVAGGTRAADLGVDRLLYTIDGASLNVFDPRLP